MNDSAQISTQSHKPSNCLETWKQFTNNRVAHNRLHIHLDREGSWPVLATAEAYHNSDGDHSYMGHLRMERVVRVEDIHGQADKVPQDTVDVEVVGSHRKEDVHEEGVAIDRTGLGNHSNRVSVESAHDSHEESNRAAALDGHNTRHNLQGLRIRVGEMVESASDSGREVAQVVSRVAFSGDIVKIFTDTYIFRTADDGAFELSTIYLLHSLFKIVGSLVLHKAFRVSTCPILLQCECRYPLPLRSRATSE